MTFGAGRGHLCAARGLRGGCTFDRRALSRGSLPRGGVTLAPQRTLMRRLRLRRRHCFDHEHHLVPGARLGRLRHFHPLTHGVLRVLRPPQLGLHLGLPKGGRRRGARRRRLPMSLLRQLLAGGHLGSLGLLEQPAARRELVTERVQRALELSHAVGVARRFGRQLVDAIPAIAGLGL